MKKHFYLPLVVVLLFCIQGYSQEESSFGAFISNPVGQFKSTDLENGGFAKTGWGIVFDSKNELKFLSEGWFLYFHSTYQWNEMDTELVAEKFTEELGNRTEVSASRYSPILMTVGPAREFALSEKFTLGINTGLGIVFGNTKAFTVKVFDANDNELANELVNFDNRVAFAYTLGAEIKMMLVENLLGIALFADYTSANQKVELSFTTANPVDSFQKMQTINAGLRIVLKKQ